MGGTGRRSEALSHERSKQSQMWQAKCGRETCAVATHTTTTNDSLIPLTPFPLAWLSPYLCFTGFVSRLGPASKTSNDMSSFAALMALSASQTRQSEAAAKNALAERQKKEAQKRKQQEEKEAKEREIERKLRIQHLEEQQREQDRQKRMEEQRRKKEEDLKRKEDEQRDALRYGPKRSKSEYPSSSSGSRSDLRRRGLPTSDDDDESGGGAALTREEKRKQRLQRELNYGSGAHKRPMNGIYKKAGRRLPGGAVDATTTNGAPSSNSYRSVKERLAHEPPQLIKLNVNKRDTRTIDEILQDRARQKAAKTLEGDDAKGFDNWFGKSKPKAESARPDSANGVSRASSMFSSRSDSPERKPSADASARPTKSLSSTPPLPSKSAASARTSVNPSASQSSAVSRPPAPAFPSFRGTGIQVKAAWKAADKPQAPNGATSKPVPTKKTSLSSDKAPARSSTSSAKPSTNSKSQAVSFRKRQRSPSLSDSPPPPKRRTQGPSNNISAEIWKLFGKDRNSYVARDVFSDDEDMEADALDVEEEEMYRCVVVSRMFVCLQLILCSLPPHSAKIARKEDEVAAELERRHEEEKRRKRKEREMRERRG